MPEELHPMLASNQHECPSVLTLIGTGCDRDLGLGIQGFAEEGRVCVRNGFLETRPALVTVSKVLDRPIADIVYLGGGILVAFHAVQRLLRSINGELRRVVATVQKYLCHYWSLLAFLNVVTHKNPWPIFTMG